MLLHLSFLTCPSVVLRVFPTSSCDHSPPFRPSIYTPQPALTSFCCCFKYPALCVWPLACFLILDLPSSLSHCPLPLRLSDWLKTVSAAHYLPCECGFESLPLCQFPERSLITEPLSICADTSLSSITVMTPLDNAADKPIPLKLTFTAWLNYTEIRLLRYCFCSYEQKITLLCFELIFVVVNTNI